ncbi:MAG: hypothetical protein GX295_11895 [Syntrophomonadaceae bacterium]|nr:hypothetical protein [Syntrophomonadaceae bacterium]
MAEGLGFQVDWDPDTRTVICWPQGESQPDVSAAQEHVKQIRDKETKQIEPNEEYTVNRGYKVPKETDLKVDFYDLYNIDVSTNILLFKPIEKQYQDLVLILTSKFSPELVDQVMAYVKQKTNWDQELKLKEWVANGCFIEVGSNAGNSGIQIDVRRI